jgi:cobalamin biosynthesis protein CobT
MKHFLNSLPIVAQALGERLGVRVVIGQREACTDGQTIHLPSLPEDKDELVVLARGYIDHEAAHVRETDFQVKPSLSPAAASFYGIFEDIRIEQLTMQKFPGSRRNLNDLVSAVQKQGGFPAPRNDDEPIGGAIQMWMLARLRSRVLGNSTLEPTADAWERLVRQGLPEGLRRNLESLLDQAATLESSAEAGALAEAVVQSLKDEQQAQEEMAQSGDSESGSPDSDNRDDASDGGQSGADAGAGEESEAGDASTDSSTSDNRQSGEQNSGGDSADEQGDGSLPDSSNQPPSSNGEEDEPDQAGSDGSGSDDSPNDAASGSSGADSAGQSGQSESQQGDDASAGSGHTTRERDEAQDPDSCQEMADQLASVIDRAHEVKGSDIADQAASLLNENGSRGRDVFEMPELVNPADRGGQPILKEDVLKQTQALRTRLASKLRAQSLTSSAPRRTGRRLDTRAVHRVAVSDTRIFKAKRPVEAPNTGLLIILDQSSSMRARESRLETATYAALSVGLATQGLKGVETIIAGYAGRGTPEIMVYKGPGENLRSDRVKAYANGSTPTAEALWWSAHQLAKLKVDRRIILNITDGDPDEYRATTTAADACIRAGMEVIGLGIGMSVDTVHCSQRTRIDSIDDLPRELFSVLEQKMIQRVA